MAGGSAGAARPAGRSTLLARAPALLDGPGRQGSSRAELEDNALTRIIQRAEQGEVAAVEWLEKRGFINMPWQRSG